MALHSDAQSPCSHRVWVVLAEKNVTVEIIDVVACRENGRGMLFPEEGELTDGDSPDDEPPSPRSRPSLKVVKWRFIPIKRSLVPAMAANTGDLALYCHYPTL